MFPLVLKFASASLCCGSRRQTDQPSEVQCREKIPSACGLGPHWSPSITKETARSSMLCSGRNGSKQTQQCKGGPLKSSAVHHIIEIPRSALLSTARCSLISNVLYHKQKLAISPVIILFLIWFDLLTWTSAGRRPGFSLASESITQT